jgi:hypothetical protein
MEKKKYYISIHAGPDTGEIRNVKGESTFDFEIEATEADVERIQELFEATQVASHDSFWRSHIPFVPYHEDKANHEYDEALIEIYRMMYDLGTSETKDHIEGMGILNL